LNESQNVVVIRSVAVFGGLVVIAVVMLAIWGPADNGRADKVIAFLATAITVIVPALIGFRLISETKAVAIEAKDEAVKSTAISLGNAAALKVQDTVLADVSDAAAAAVDIGNSTHEIVNSQRTAMKAEIAELRESLNEMKKTLAVERAVKGANESIRAEVQASTDKEDQVRENEAKAGFGRMSDAQPKPSPS